ncbi:uncharacterized protein LOC131432963 [Malaya genurostris]|uniref:uncharacterized protein LOC131432963 n=1 Tax=Malaya genurostris TaxID=325434 RepID=UPI0026F3BF56|nr:uncharacterized protein LOC131432963 [Malaya genurostris]
MDFAIDLLLDAAQHLEEREEIVSECGSKSASDNTVFHSLIPTPTVIRYEEVPWIEHENVNCSNLTSTFNFSFNNIRASTPKVFDNPSTVPLNLSNSMVVNEPLDLSFNHGDSNLESCAVLDLVIHDSAKFNTDTTISINNGPINLVLKEKLINSKELQQKLTQDNQGKIVLHRGNMMNEYSIKMQVT